MEEQAKYRTARNKKNDDAAGRIPPQATDIEETVLGAILLEKDALLTVIDIIKKEIFYQERHQIIYDAISKLFNEKQAIDILTVTNKLRELGQLETIGGPYYLTQLTNRVASAANIEYHTRIIQQRYFARELIRISGQVQHDAYSDDIDIFEQINNAELALMQIADGEQSKRIKAADVINKEVIKKIFEIYKHQDKLTGIATGYTDLDRITGGWQASDLVIIAGRPGMGKSTLALNCATYCTRRAVPAAYFSLEMSAEQLITKIVANENNIELTRLNTGKLANAEVNILHDYQEKGIQQLFIDDTPAISTQELRAKAIRLKQKHGIKLIIIDYLQLMIASGLTNKETREREISKISQSLKALAKELEIPVIALSQLSRQVENRGGTHRPVLSDLRESGSIENDADVVIFCYRPEYYKLESCEHNRQTYSSNGLALIDIAKGRNIGTGDILLNFSGRYSRFTDYNELFEADNDPLQEIEETTKNPFN